jgi:beta-aspartyl-peptidase (threonine type)
VDTVSWEFTVSFRRFALAFGIFALSVSAFAQTEVTLDAATFIHQACATGCPAYSLKIDNQGLVRYDGKGFVKVFGQKTWAIPTNSAEGLLARLKSADLVAGERAGKFLTEDGACSATKSETHAAVVIEIDGHEEMPIPACYSPALEKIVEDADAVSAASIYTLGRHEQSELAIRAVLDMQVVAWNKGDIEGFMRGYWMSKDLTFFSGGSETHGWTETLERYRKSYKGTGKQMGQLTFGDLRIEMLSPDSAFVRGTWKLAMPADAKTPHGLFTLIFRKTPDGWRIIHDSTGAA